jgi:hypothetical protein
MSIAEKLALITENEQKVYEAGKKADHDEFWDAFQSDGTLTSYSYAFAYGRWNDETFKPKYDIKPTSANFMFAYNNNVGTGTSSKYCITDLSACFERTGTKLDTSSAIEMQQVFYMGKGFTRLPPISFENCIELSATFYGCTELRTIDKLILKSDGTNTFTKNSWDFPFGQCTALKNITIEGSVGDSINLSHSPLTAESLVSVVEHLSDTATKKTATFKQSAINSADWSKTNFSSWNELIALKPDWTFSLV